ncbi:hypothetical protein ABW19_dt0201781 [Dactylella cylindrospora]|nr:hypothetical protein ABW19_dt0201781 [Dactylella cylindrospora]
MHPGNGYTFSLSLRNILHHSTPPHNNNQQHPQAGRPTLHTHTHHPPTFGPSRTTASQIDSEDCFFDPRAPYCFLFLLNRASRQKKVSFWVWGEINYCRLCPFFLLLFNS